MLQSMILVCSWKYQYSRHLELFYLEQLTDLELFRSNTYLVVEVVFMFNAKTT